MMSLKKIFFPSSIKELLSITTIKSKVALLVLLLFFICLIFGIALRKFTTTDFVPQLKPINTKAIKALGPFAVQVKIGMFVKSFPVFEIIKNDFLIDSIIWFEFNADEIMLETIEKFSFDKGKILSKTPSDIKIAGNKIFAKYNVVFQIKSDLNYHKFPFEDHRIAIVISNDFVTPEEMYYAIDGGSFQVPANIFPASWKLQDLNVDVGYLELNLDKQDPSKKTSNPKALFTINVVKASIRKFLIIFIPLFSALFLSLFSFVMNIANVVGKFSLSISAVTALLGYRFVIEQMMPQVGYFTTTDELYLFLLIVAFLCFIFQLLITRAHMVLAEEQKNKPTPEHSHTHEEPFPLRLEKINSYTFLVTVFIIAAVLAFLILK